MLNQNFQEPFVAIVIDPVRTISAGKVCLGAFRTYPKVSGTTSGSIQIPKAKNIFENININIHRKHNISRYSSTFYYYS